MLTLKSKFFRNLAPLFVTGIALILTLGEAIAEPTSSTEAGTVVQTWLSSEKHPLHTSTGSKIQRISTQNDETGKPLYHVVYLTNDGTSTKGFVIVGGDSEEEPIMAISSGSEFAATPDNPLFALMNRHATGLANQLRQAGPRPLKAQAAATVAKHRWSRLLSPKPAGATAQVVTSGSTASISDVRVAPLVQSTWNQLTADNFTNGPACYNYYTPPFAAGNSSNYYCGCVATAVAQVMRYWQYPTTAVGTAKFGYTVSGVAATGALRGGNGTGGAYDWSSMPLSPTSSITTTQAQAIGALVHDVAMVADTDFTPNGSSSYLDFAVTGLISTFHYANAVDVYAADSISTQSLVAMMTPSLDAGTPVCIAFLENGGHALICDGYGYNGGVLYHHLNFGWGGADDVWYALPTANTDNGNFSTVDEVSFNIFPTITGEIISGRVTDANGSPLAGASVTAAISGGATYTATSGTNGIYAFKGVPASTTYTVSASLSGYAFTNRTATTAQSVTGPWGSGFDGAFGSVSGIDFSDTQNTATLSVTASPSNGGTVTGGGSFAAGSSHQISATANAGWTFAGWNDSDTTNPRTVLVPAQGASYTATFIQSPVVITSPAPGSTLTSSSATFIWNSVNGATQYTLWIGTTPGTSDLYLKSEGTALTDTASVPINGRTIYVTLWSMINGTWQQTQAATYTSWTSPVAVKARIISPSNNSTLASSSLALTWDGGNGATQYSLAVGSTPQGSDLFSAAEGTNLNTTVTVPTDGRKIYVTMWSYINKKWVANNYIYTAYTTPGSALAEITSPVENSTLSGSPVTFNWSKCTRATQYALWVGSSPGAYDLYAKAEGAALTDTVKLPTDGSPVYVRVGSYINKQYVSSDNFVYTTQTNPPSGPVKAVITSPANDSTLTSASATFTWSQGTGVTKYALSIGSAPGKYDLYSKVEGTALTDTVTLPTDGRQIYVVMMSYINAKWVSNNYVFTAYTAPGTAIAALTSPAENTTLPGASVTFNWSACTRATQYVLWIGTAPGKYDLYAKIEGAALTDTVTLPTDGSPVYIRVGSYINKQWVSSANYVYQTFGP